ncbi:MAG: nuclear transport factor 2 family protein, partial [Aestuariivirga sp.]|nr:nuclear transport factor 2 family protein [Aestuariivirga sp.]
MAADSERAAIEAVILAYLQGMIYGEFDKLRGAMHPQCMVAGHYHCDYVFVTREDFIGVLSEDKPEPPGTPIDYKIHSIDITKDTAVAKLVDVCLGSTFTDTLTFIR